MTLGSVLRPLIAPVPIVKRDLLRIEAIRAGEQKTFQAGVILVSQLPPDSSRNHKALDPVAKILEPSVF